METNLPPSTTPHTLLWLGLLFPPHQPSLMWIFSCCPSSRTFQNPSMVVLSFAAVSPKLWGLTGAPRLQPPLHWSLSLDCGSPGMSKRTATRPLPGFPPTSRRQREQQGHGVKRAAGLSSGKTGVLYSSGNVRTRKLRSQRKEQEWDCNTECRQRCKLHSTTKAPHTPQPTAVR